MFTIWGCSSLTFPFLKIRLCPSNIMKTLLASTTMLCIKLATAVCGSGHYLNDWILEDLNSLIQVLKVFYSNMYHTKYWVKTSGKSKEIRWLNIVNFSLHRTALLISVVYYYYSKRARKPVYRFFLYVNGLNINTKGIKLSSILLNTQKQSRKKTLFAMTYSFCFLFWLTFTQKLQWILNHESWIVVFLNKPRIFSSTLSFSWKEGNLEVL